MTKNELRFVWKRVRDDISTKRKFEAIQALDACAFTLSKNNRYVLSYASFDSEFCTKKINRYLAKRGKLLLPKICDNCLEIYEVRDLDSELKKNSWGILEPISDICTKIAVERVTCVLVPALAFDADKHRLGYGGGYYDRFLRTLANDTMTFGLGFKEQYHAASLPTTGYDVPLKDLLLF